MQHWSDCTRKGGRERENVTRTSYGTYFPENLLLRRFPPKIVLRKSCPWKNFPGKGNWKEIVPWKSCPIKKLSLKKCVPKKKVSRSRGGGGGGGKDGRWDGWQGGECKFLLSCFFLSTPQPIFGLFSLFGPSCLMGQFHNQQSRIATDVPDS